MIMTSAVIKASRASPQTSGTCHASASRGTISYKLASAEDAVMDTVPNMLVY